MKWGQIPKNIGNYKVSLLHKDSKRANPRDPVRKRRDDPHGNSGDTILNSPRVAAALSGPSARGEHKFRQFYREYPIQQTVSVESGKAPSAPLNWQTVSVELLQRFNSSLYERLALSCDKKEVRRLSQKGQTVEKAADIIKNPLVLEFL